MRDVADGPHAGSRTARAEPFNIRFAASMIRFSFNECVRSPKSALTGLPHLRCNTRRHTE